MGIYDSLITALQQQNEADRAANPFINSGKSLVSTTSSMPIIQGGGFWQNFLPRAVGGLLGGVSTGIGESQSSDIAAQRASDLEKSFVNGMPSSLPNSLSFLSPIFASEVAKAKEGASARAQEFEDFVKKEAVKSDPKFRKSLLAGMADAPFLKPLFEPQSQPIAKPLESQIGGNPVDIYQQTYQQALDQGIDEVSARQLANKQTEGLFSKRDNSLKGLQSDYDRAEQLKSFADIATQGMAKAGVTGNPVATMANSFLAKMGLSKDAAEKRAGDTLLDSLRQDAIRAFYQKGQGNLNQAEVDALIKTAPSSKNTPAENLILRDKIAQLSQLEGEYAQAKEQWVLQNNTDFGFDRAWKEYKANNPMVVPGQTGDYIANFNRPDFYSWMGQSQGAPDSSSNAVQLNNTINAQQPQATWQQQQNKPQITREQAIAELRRRGAL